MKILSTTIFGLTIIIILKWYSDLSIQTRQYENIRLSQIESKLYCIEKHRDLFIDIMYRLKNNTDESKDLYYEQKIENLDAQINMLKASSINKLRAELQNDNLFYLIN